MPCLLNTTRSPGFTLIELIIVSMVIAILSLIIIPRVTGAVRKARESTLRDNLRILRAAISHFNADTGLYPSALNELAYPVSAPPATGINENGNAEAIPESTYQGPYLNSSQGIGATGIPVNPFKHPSEADYADPDAHWTYGVDGPGIVRAAAPAGGSTLDGMSYSEL